MKKLFIKGWLQRESGGEKASLRAVEDTWTKYNQFSKYLKNMTIESHAYFNIYELYVLRNNLDKAEKYLDLSGIPIEEVIDHCI